MPRSSARREELIVRLQLLGEQESTETAMFHQAAAASYGLGITDMKALQIVLREGPPDHWRGHQRPRPPGA
jgi:hypothetical protein